MMRYPLKGGNVAMEFGHTHEEDARKRYEDRVMAQGYVRDEAGMATLREYLAKGEGSMAYSPDDLFVKRNATGEVEKRLLVDYKSPYSGKIPDAPPFSYVAQLHQGVEVFGRAGVPIDELALCYLDHPDNLLKPKEARLLVYGIDIDMDLIDVIKRECDAFIEKVRNGVRPMPVVAGMNSEDLQDRLYLLFEKQKKLVEISQQQKLLDSEIKKIRQEMAGLVEPLLQPGETLSSEDLGLQVSARTSSEIKKGKDQEVLEIVQQILEESNVTDSEILQYEVDMKKLGDFLLEHGSSLHDFSFPKGVNLSSLGEAFPEVLKSLQQSGLVLQKVSFAVPSKLELHDLSNPWKKMTESSVMDDKEEGNQEAKDMTMDDFDDIPLVATVASEEGMANVG